MDVVEISVSHVLAAPQAPKFAAPVGGQAIDLREAPEQMKILLSNPLVLEQRKIAAAQQKPTKYGGSFLAFIRSRDGTTDILIDFAN